MNEPERRHGTRRILFDDRYYMCDISKLWPLTNGGNVSKRFHLGRHCKLIAYEKHPMLTSSVDGSHLHFLGKKSIISEAIRAHSHWLLTRNDAHWYQNLSNLESNSGASWKSCISCDNTSSHSPLEPELYSLHNSCCGKLLCNSSFSQSVNV